MSLLGFWGFFKLMNGFNEGDGNLVSRCWRKDLRTWKDGTRE